jgi:Na+/H+ antiporter NhaD/arsenite permease-like protein
VGCSDTLRSRSLAVGFGGLDLLGAIVTIFVIEYAAIALEHPIKINKSASALVGAGLLWSVYARLSGDPSLVEQQLNQAVSSTAQVVFFLIGAMTIVEVIDAHNGFEVITSLIRTGKQTTLMWLVGFVTFFLSAILDNLTTTIVMISLMRKLLGNQHDRLFFTAMIVIAANAGGAWSAIGDVTTTMLWIGGQITTLSIIKGIFLAALANLIVPRFFLSYLLRGRAIIPPREQEGEQSRTNIFERNLTFYLGISILVLVPAFKSLTHLPPFMGILFGLGILWMVSELIHRDKQEDERKRLTLVHALKRIDMSSIVFFIGICQAYQRLRPARLFLRGRRLYRAVWLASSLRPGARPEYRAGITTLMAAEMCDYAKARTPAREPGLRFAT